MTVARATTGGAAYDLDRAKALARIERSYAFARRGESPKVGRAIVFALPTFCVLAIVKTWMLPLPWAAVVGITLMAYAVGWRTSKYKSTSQRLYVLLERFDPHHVDLYKQVQKEARDGSWDSFAAALEEWIGYENAAISRGRPLSATEQAKEAFLSKQL